MGKKSRQVSTNNEELQALPTDKKIKIVCPVCSEKQTWFGSLSFYTHYRFAHKRDFKKLIGLKSVSCCIKVFLDLDFRLDVHLFKKLFCPKYRDHS